ncbi:hypothetical protein DBV15_05122 [Temnothorax longispinosus]|uniref:Uncharacterized protein n=1 Tax=Temnothorax longispinosus TaxID=300112 RepID=A0A4S2KUL4_9HYME|nr:hypothetical protein DBV15_05122 [Temnothorax longispinosus]
MFFLCRNRLESNTEHWNALLLSLRELIEWVIRKDTELTGLGPVCGDVAALQKQQASRRECCFAHRLPLASASSNLSYSINPSKLQDSSQVTWIGLIYLKSISYSRPPRSSVQLSLRDTTAHPEYGYLRILITFEYSASWKQAPVPLIQVVSECTEVISRMSLDQIIDVIVRLDLCVFVTHTGEYQEMAIDYP